MTTTNEQYLQQFDVFESVHSSEHATAWVLVARAVAAGSRKAAIMLATADRDGDGALLATADLEDGTFATVVTGQWQEISRRTETTTAEVWS